MKMTTDRAGNPYYAANNSYEERIDLKISLKSDALIVDWRDYLPSKIQSLKGKLIVETFLVNTFKQSGTQLFIYLYGATNNVIS